MALSLLAFATALSSLPHGRPVPPSACLEPRPTIAAEFARSELVVVGRVLSARVVPDSGPWLTGTVYSVQASRVFRGDPAPTIRIFSENSTGRFPMDVDSSYVLFIYRAGGRIHVDPCGHSAPVRAASALLADLERLTVPRGTQEASARALGPLGPAASWHCAVVATGAPSPLTNPIMMTFTLLTPSAPSPADSTQRIPLRVITAGFMPDGEVLTLGEIVLDSTATPRVQTPQITRTPGGEYTGLRIGGPILTDAEVAAALALAKELWRRRCAGPRA